MTIECWQAHWRWDPASEFPRPLPPSAAQENALKNLASQFFDTYATQFSQSAAGKQSTETENFWDRFKVVDGGKGAA